MTAPPAVATEEWLARWREAASQCWGRVGTCCRSCRVEALDPPDPSAATAPHDALSGSVSDERPVSRVPGRSEAHSGDLSPDTTTDHERPGRAA